MPLEKWVEVISPPAVAELEATKLANEESAEDQLSFSLLSLQ